jgi:hypothetical protein
MNLAQLSKWLRKTPQPATIVLDGAKRLTVGPGGAKWTELARSIEAAGATKLEALDGQGNLVRAVTIEDENEPADRPTELQSDLQVLSKIIADAYEKGTLAPSKLLDSAMTFIERQGQRLVAQDREIERLRSINARLSAEIMQLKAIPMHDEDSDGGIMGALIQGALQGQLAAGAADEPIPQPNGKGRK